MPQSSHIHRWYSRLSLVSAVAGGLDGGLMDLVHQSQTSPQTQTRRQYDEREEPVLTANDTEDPAHAYVVPIGPMSAIPVWKAAGAEAGAFSAPRHRKFVISNRSRDDAKKLVSNAQPTMCMSAGGVTDLVHTALTQILVVAAGGHQCTSHKRVPFWTGIGQLIHQC